MKIWLTIGLTVITSPVLLVCGPAVANPDLDQQVNRVVQYLEGQLSTSQRAAQNPKIADVTMTTCRVQLEPAGTADRIYLYQEQAITSRMDKPYRQRILEISASPLSQTVRSRSFKLVNQTQWINFCDRPNQAMHHSDLAEAVCSVFLKARNAEFIGVTEATGCPAKVRGAVLIRNHIRLYPGGMETWDRGYDAQGKQVWGADDEPYQFRRSATTNGIVKHGDRQ